MPVAGATVSGSIQAKEREVTGGYTSALDSQPSGGGELSKGILAAMLRQLEIDAKEF